MKVQGSTPRVVRVSFKGRGAANNPLGRFEREEREVCDDGWDGEHEEEHAPRTEVTLTRARSIITRSDSPDIAFTQSINPGQGCEHGCNQLDTTRFRPPAASGRLDLI